MLLCDVLPGRKYKTQKRMNGPPAGYNSVEGEVGMELNSVEGEVRMELNSVEGEVGMELNYPAILLTRSEAIMPRFIIVY